MEQREEALNYIAKEMAYQAVRDQVATAEATFNFLKGVEGTEGDEDFQNKLRIAEKELKAVSSPAFLTALENTYAEVYNQLEDKHLLRFADELEYQQAVIQVGTLNGPRVEKLVEEFLDGTYKAPTIQ